MSNNINSAIRSALYSLGITQQEFARQAGITQPGLNRLMNGSHRIKCGTLRKLFEVLKHKNKAAANNLFLEHLRDEIHACRQKCPDPQKKTWHGNDMAVDQDRTLKDIAGLLDRNHALLPLLSDLVDLMTQKTPKI